MENGLNVEGLFDRAAGDPKDPLELVEVQGAAWTLLHEKKAQFLYLRQVQLLGAALVLSHGPPPDGLLSVRSSSPHSPTELCAIVPPRTGAEQQQPQSH